MTQDKFKYPSTPHHPSSPGVQNDDSVIAAKNLKKLEGQDFVLMHKKDGENTSGYPDGSSHARSLDSQSNWTRDIVKAIMAVIRYQIPEGHKLVMENCYAEHSIRYEDGELDGYLYLLSVWNDRTCLSFDKTVELAEQLDLPMPKILYRGPYYEGVIETYAAQLDTRKVEGMVGRLTRDIHFDEFDQCFIKWVRAGHVQTDEHWLKHAKPNGKPKAPGKPAWLGIYAK